MLDGHFDYGNGYHGRAYLNAHLLFRHPSTIWQFAQDLIDLLPGDLLQRVEVVAGPVTGGALLAHTIAGLLDSRRSLTHPPLPVCAVHPPPGRRAHAARASTGARLPASGCCWSTMSAIPGTRWRAAAGSSRRRTASCSPRRKSTIASNRSTISACRTSRSPSTRRPKTFLKRRVLFARRAFPSPNSEPISFSDRIPPARRAPIRRHRERPSTY